MIKSLRWYFFEKEMGEASRYVSIACCFSLICFLLSIGPKWLVATPTLVIGIGFLLICLLYTIFETEGWIRIWNSVFCVFGLFFLSLIFVLPEIPILFARLIYISCGSVAFCLAAIVVYFEILEFLKLKRCLYEYTL